MTSPSNSGPDVSIVIVNWNTRELLRNCLQSIMDQTQAAHEVIVVDNNSSDGSAQMVRDSFPDVVLIANSDNKGFAGANNQGLRIVRGGHVLLLNPDTLILEGAIDKSLAWLAQRPDVGCLGCQVWETVDVIQRTSFADPGLVNLSIVEFGLMGLARKVPFFGRPWYVGWDRKSEREVDVVSGMFMLVPRDVMNKVGILDDAFFVYSEEADWCRRIRDAGYKCVFAPVARIMHLDGGGKSTVQIRSRMYVQMQKSHLIYVRKHDGWLSFQLTRLIFVASSLLRLALFGALQVGRRKPEDKARVRLAIASIGYHLFGRQPTT